MAAHSFFGGELRPDQERYARMAGGMSSPLWIPFMAAASMGAAWWMMQNWPRLASGVAKSGDGEDASGRTNGLSASAPAAAPPTEAIASSARTFAQEVAAPVTESVAVQGANDAEASPRTQARAPTPPAPTPEPAPAPRAKAAPAPAPAPKAEAAPRKEKAPRKAAGSDQDPAVSKLLAAAAASHPEPELPPHEGLPARKKGGGKGKKNGG